MYPIDFFHRAAARFRDRVALDTPEALGPTAGCTARCRRWLPPCRRSTRSRKAGWAICAGNTAQHVVALLAVIASGKIWVPLNYRSTAPEIGRILDATEPGIVITDHIGDALVDAGRAAHVRLDGGAGGHTLSGLLQAYAGREPARCEPGVDAVQAIKFTGGTTGLPKGVMQPYRAWTAVIINQIKRGGSPAKTAMWSPRPSRMAPPPTCCRCWHRAAPMCSWRNRRRPPLRRRSANAAARWLSCRPR